MPADHRAVLADIRTFPQLVSYLHKEMGWPIDSDDFEELTFDYSPEELGIDLKNAAKIQEIKRLRPLSVDQPWGIFFVKFEPKRLPVVALRRILSQVVQRKRASANRDDRAAWAAEDLLFVSNYGESGEERRIAFAHFSEEGEGNLPTLKVLGWDNLDTPLHLDDVADKLTGKLAWPEDEKDVAAWRERWRSAFTMRHGQVIRTSKDLSIRLAHLARAIRDRIKTALDIETETGPLTKLMNAFRESLVHDLNEKKFADMYAQTIAYGLLSTRIANPSARGQGHLPAQIPVTNPFLKEMMETFLHVGGRRGRRGGPGIDFDELGVSEVVDLLDEADMEAVVRDFGDRNPQEDPVIHFYELFLKEYDAKERARRGVFYTPRPVVSYIVRSVDELLRTEFHLEDGLADTTTWAEMAKRFSTTSPSPSRGEGQGEGEAKGITIPNGTPPTSPFVTILDPACGTGTFLVEVIDTIHRTMTAKWKGQGRNEAAILDLWNKYVPKHLLPRLHGYELLMAPYAIAHLKIGLKLHETGYRFGSDERARIYLTNALEPASDLGQQSITGLFPALAHEAQAVNEVKRHRRFIVVIGNPPYNNRSENKTRWIMNLIEAYKSTVRREETQIQGLSDDYVKFLRLADWHLMRAGAGILGMITNNGYLDGHIFRDMREHLVKFSSQLRVFNLHGDARKKERAPDHSPDKNVFDIMQGVAVLTLSTGAACAPDSDFSCGDAWGDRKRKYRALSESLPDEDWVGFSPRGPLWMLVPGAGASTDWDSASPLAECFGTGDWQEDKTDAYGSGFKSQQDEFAIAFVRDDLVANIETLLEPNMTEAELRKRFSLCSTNQWSYARARERLRRGEWRNQVQRVLFRPFDFRYTVITQDVVTNPRREIMAHLERANLGLLATRKATEGFAVFITRVPCGHKIVGNYDMTTVFPLYLYRGVADGCPERPSGKELNLSPGFLGRLDAVVPGAGRAPESIVHYMYALFHSSTYRDRYAESLKNDFPRVLLPGGPDLFYVLVGLGSELVSLHLLESPRVDDYITTYVGPKHPTVERVGWSDETVWLDAAATKKGQPAKPGTIGFKGVREEVWNFHIGGYQVCEKWLKDRKGRTLSADDIRHYQRIVVALSETIRIMAEIDKVIESLGGWPGAFATVKPENAATTEPVAAQSPGRPRKPVQMELMPPPLIAAMEESASKADHEMEDAPLPLHEAEDGASRRHPTDMDRDELLACIRAAFSSGTPRTRYEAITELARDLGWERTSPTMRDSLDNALRVAVLRGILANEGGSLRLFARSVEEYDRDFLKDQFLASLPGKSWTTREDAIRAFARHLGFRRTGKTIEEAARSLISGLIREESLEGNREEIRRAGRP